MAQMRHSKVIGNDFYIAVPILMPYPAQGIDEKLQENILNEVQFLEGSFFVDGVKIDYKSLKEMEKYKYITQRLSPRRFGLNRMFVFRMTVTDVSHFLKPLGEISAEQNFFFSMFFNLPIFVYSLAYALGIYSNGIFDVDDFITYYNESNYGNDRGIINTFPCLYDHDDELYKSMTNLSLQRILNWFLSIDDVLNACGTTALGKSLSIYSRMFSSHSSDEDFFLSVAHGGFEFPFRFNAPDGGEEFEKAFVKTEKSYDVGLRYLFKSYRKMIIQNKKELSFTYTCL